MPLKFTLPLVAAAAVYGQTAFEAASIKAVGAETGIMVRPRRTTGRISWTTDLCRLIGYAHSLELSQLQLKPDQRCGNIYVLEATYDAAATENQVRSMLLSLLTERFKLRTHRETSEAEGYALVLGRGGPKIKEDTSSPPDKNGGKEPRLDPPLENHIYSTGPEPGVSEVTGQRVAMARLADTLKHAVGGLPVWDRTGLPGVYSFKFRYAGTNAPADANAPSIAAALQDLGLRLEKAKGTVEKLVVDSFEKPSEN